MNVADKIIAPLKAVVNYDGWANVLTGLGMAGKDKRTGAVAFWQRMDESTAEALYAGDDVAAKIVNCLPEDAMREGYDFTGWSDAQKLKLEEEKGRLNIDAKVEEAWKNGRAYGGAALLMVTDDDPDMSQPLNMANVTRLLNLIPLTRWELTASSDIEKSVESPNFGNPNTYQLSARGVTMDANAQRIHHSRIVRFDGARLTSNLFVKNNYWHDSVLTRSYNAISNFNTGNDSVALALQDFRVGVFKMKNLSHLIANNKDAEVMKRLQMIQMAKSVARSIVINDDESWTETATSFAGIPEILERLKSRLLVAADGIPHTKLFGESPAGLGGSGRSTEVTWYDFVSSRQENILKPRLAKLYAVVAAQRKLNLGTVPPNIGLAFRPLWQLDEKEQVEMRNKQANTDSTYIQDGVLDPEEVRTSRFGKEGYSIQTNVAAATDLPEGTSLAPEASAPPAANAAGGVQQQALNGAQLASIVAVVKDVVNKAIPYDTGVQLILVAFPYLKQEDAARILEAAKNFVPAAPATENPAGV